MYVCQSSPCSALAPLPFRRGCALASPGSADSGWRRSIGRGCPSRFSLSLSPLLSRFPVLQDSAHFPAQTPCFVRQNFLGMYRLEEKKGYTIIFRIRI